MTNGSADHLALYSDRGLGRLVLAPSPSYPSDSETDFYVPHETIDFRRRLSNIALQLQDQFAQCDRNLGWNIDWAVAFLVHRLQTTPGDAAESLRRIRIRAATLEREGLIQEIPYRIFNKVDEVLFAGHLKNAVFLDISSLGSDISGATYTHSWGPNTNVKRISIVLNRDALEYARARDVVAMLIHHMIHAYFLVACGPQKEEEVDYGRLDHGVHFGAIMLAIKKLSAVHGKELTPLGFGHSSAAVRYFAEEYYYPRKGGPVEREDKEKWYCSHCHCNVEGISECDIDKWYSKVCKPMFDQPKSVRVAEGTIYNDRRHEFETERRARLPPSAKSVEFIFKGNPILVASKKIDDFLGVRRAFGKAESRFLGVHKDVSEKTFLRFLEFLHTGSYRPDQHPFAAAAASLGVERNGPPIVKPQGMSTEACLLADVQFAKLGILMGFDECKYYALRRMNAYGVIYEDPVAILKEIYHGYEPDPDLKAWARRFLVQAPAKTSPEYTSTSFPPSSSIEPPNLIKLESEHGIHRARFLDAIDSSGALENDVNKARAELRLAGWYGVSSLLPHTSSSFLTTSLPLRYSSNPLPLSLTRPSPLLLDAAAPSPLHSWLGTPGIASAITPQISNLSTLDLERLRDAERESLLDYERAQLKDLERGRLHNGYEQRDILRILGRERSSLSDLERERENLKEVQARVHAAKVLERFYSSGLTGLGPDDERY